MSKPPCRGSAVLRSCAPALLLPLLLAACAPGERVAPAAPAVAAPAAAPAAGGTCPDLQGTWSSAVYHPFEVSADGSRLRRGATTATLEVTHQDGCAFQAVNRSSGAIEGAEPVAGVIDAASGEITMVEVGPHPEGDASAWITAALVAPDRMIWDYVGLADDDSRGEAFAVGLHRGASPPERAECPDLTGTWKSAVFHPLKVFADGRRETQAPTSTTLEVVAQEGCAFQAVNSWSAGELGGSEPVVGTVSGESGVVTMREVGPHPKGGSSALITARLPSPDQMTWEYVGLADDDSMGQVFTTALHRGSSPPERAACPELVGRWSSAPFEPLKVFADGSRDVQPPTHATLEVTHQEGCAFEAVNSWSAGDLGGSEPVAGVIRGESQDLLMVEIGPHPEGGSSALILATLEAPDHMTWRYVGLADDDSMGQVFVTELTRP